MPVKNSASLVSGETKGLDPNEVVLAETEAEDQEARTDLCVRILDLLLCYVEKDRVGEGGAGELFLG